MAAAMAVASTRAKTRKLETLRVETLRVSKTLRVWERVRLVVIAALISFGLQDGTSARVGRK
jgi:hypothetical protein